MIFLLKKCFSNFYYFIVLLGFTTMLGLRDWYSYLMLIPIFVFVFTFRTIKLHAFDVFVLLLIFYYIISVFWSGELLVVGYMGFREEVIPILFYFIARSNSFQNNVFFENMKYPLAIAFICAIALYFFPPDWYVSFKKGNLPADATSTMIYEHTRLSGFWGWSYFIGYSSLFFIMYQVNKLLREEKLSIYNILFIFIALIVLFFAQQRVSIAFFFLYLIIVTIHAYKKKMPNRSALKFFWLIIIFVGMIIFYLMTYYLDSSFTEYVFNRTLESDDNILTERFGMFSDMLKVSFLGDGLGSHIHGVAIYRLKVISDCDYIRILTQYGVLGTCVLGCIIFDTLIKGAIVLEHVLFDFLVVLFLCIAMTGAAPLSHTPLQPYLYWFCMGRIQSVYFHYKRTKTQVKRCSLV